MSPTRAGYLLLAIGLVGAAVLVAAGRMNPYFLYVINLGLINAIAAIGLVILSGAAGQMSLGTAALLAIGAYVTGMLMTHAGVPFLAAGLLGAVSAMVIGTLLAAPALRLTGLHLAIVTLAFGVIVVQLIGKGGSWTGGMSGLTLPETTIFSVPIDTEPRRFWLFSLIFVVVTWCSANFMRLKPGRALLALREREITARALGINTSGYKTLAFAYSSFLAGLAGALYATLKSYISVDDFTIWNSIYFFVMIAIGGMTSIIGGIAGALVVTALPELLRGLKESADAVFGIVLMLVIIFLPNGISGLLATLWTRATANLRPGRTR